jgi:hypothetical protein
MEGVEPGTVWTWNAIGKHAGAWGLAADAPEVTTGFLLNHLISEHLQQRGADGRRITNSDPVTGQAAWFDVRVRLRKCTADELPVAARAASHGGGRAQRATALRWPEWLRKERR